MDVSIAVSLIRGQMGTVVERAVNGAVETVLAEMLKVVGVKFEELKSQVVVLKRDISTLQREKALKEKENDNIRAKLRYTELKLKYYRQGVEEELQQRASAATLVRIHPPSLLQTQKGGAAVSPTGATPSRLPQPRTTERAVTRRNQECTSSQSTSCHAVRVPLESQGVAMADSSNLHLPVSLPVITPAESLDSSTVLFSPTEPDATKSKADQDDCEWTITLRPHTECMDTVMVPPPPAESSGQPPVAGSLFPDGSTQADSSTRLPSATQVKQEAQYPQEEEEEVICIKEEPDEEQEVTATLLLDCQEEQDHLAESETQMQTSTHWSGLPANHTNHTTVMSSAGQNTYPLHQMVTSIPSMVALQPGIPPRQAVQPWTKDLSLYEEYKLRRNELRRRNLSRRRELEKSLPQPLLADLVRERREKTRLRVARWRAKRKLQACLNQAQAQGVAADVSVSPTGFPISSQHEAVRLPYASSTQPGSALLNSMSAANISATLPFKVSTSSSNPLLRGTNMSAHEHTVTSSSPYPQVSLLQQSISLVDTDILP